MLRICLAVLLCLFASPALAADPMPPDSTPNGPMDKADVVIVRFGDSTCITSYLPTKQRVEAVLNDRLSNFYKNQKTVSHNVAAGGDYMSILATRCIQMTREQESSPKPFFKCCPRSNHVSYHTADYPQPVDRPTGPGCRSPVARSRR